MVDLRTTDKRFGEILEKYGDIEAHLYANMNKRDRARYSSCVAGANRDKRKAPKPSVWLETNELMPFAEIAKIMGITPSAARNIYERALQKLRDASANKEFAINF